MTEKEGKFWLATAMLLSWMVAGMIGLAWGRGLAFVSHDEYAVRVITTAGTSLVRCEEVEHYVFLGDNWREVKGIAATYPTMVVGGPTYSGGYRAWVGLDELGREKFIPAQLWGTVNFQGRTTHNSGNWVTDACLANVPKRLT